VPASGSRPGLATSAPSGVLTLTASVGLADATRLLEATAGVVMLTADAAAELFGRFTPPEDAVTADLYARLIETLAGHLDAGSRDQVLGSFRDRAVALTRAEPTAVEVVVDEPARTVTAGSVVPLLSAAIDSPSLGAVVSSSGLCGRALRCPPSGTRTAGPDDPPDLVTAASSADPRPRLGLFAPADPRLVVWYRCGGSQAARTAGGT
jgi:hypothetical protein